MNEITKVELPEGIKESLRVGKSRITPTDYNQFRPLLSVSLPLSFTGATPPRPCPGHPPSLVGGIAKRFGYLPPSVSRPAKRRLRRFVDVWCKRNLIPLTPSDIPTFEDWLDKTPYPAGRKEELRQKWKAVEAEFDTLPPSDIAGRLAVVKGFIKDETYPEYKYPRLINSRIDEAKCLFGPTIDAISHHLMSTPWFIKYTPVPERPKVLRDVLYQSGGDYIFTDYTAFEAHFTPEVMEICQFRLYKYMLSKSQNGDRMRMIYELTVAGTNCLMFKHLSAKIDGVRMSGEMDTSLSNGFCNLMIFLFLCDLNGAQQVVGFVEGDDGIFRVSPASAAPTKQQFADCGFTIKIGTTTELSTASFCGQVYDMDDLKVVTDPVEVISRLGYTNKKYVNASERTRLQLLRAKGFSLVYQYAGCPILQTLGWRILELTSHIHIEKRIFDAMDQWEKQKLNDAMNSVKNLVEQQIGDNTRALVEQLYNVPVSVQLEIETLFAKIEFGLHKNPLQDFVPKVWEEYYTTYSTEIPHLDPAWLIKDESAYLARLKGFKNLHGFVKSVQSGG
jgi:hypothetical protein